jgi:hypothetical protein
MQTWHIEDVIYDKAYCIVLYDAASNLYSNIRGILYIKCAFINEQPVHYYLFHFNAESCKSMRNKIEFCGMKIHLTLFHIYIKSIPQ